MAKVTIKEYDSSQPSTTVGQYDLPVYIPGYAKFGPENTPTLIAGGDSALETFKKTFGDAPYIFKADQIVGGETLRYKGEYEQSYIEAYEYASLGYPIVYERVCPYALDKADKTLRLIKNRAVVEHILSEEEKINQTTATVVRTGDSAPYTYEISGLRNDKAFVDSYFGAVNSGSDYKWGVEIGEYSYHWLNGTMADVEDDSGVVKESCSFSVTSGTVVIVSNTELLGSGVVTGECDVLWTIGTSSYKYEVDIISIYAEANKKISVKSQKGTWTDITDMQVYNQNSTVKYGDMLTYIRSGSGSDTNITFNFKAPNLSKTITESTNVTEEEEGTLIIEAKYGGEYGNEIAISVEDTNSSDLFRIVVDYGNEQETFNVSLARDDSAFIGNISSAYVQVNAQSLAGLSGDVVGVKIANEELGLLTGGGNPAASSTQPDEFTIGAMYALLTGEDQSMGNGQTATADDVATNQYWKKFEDKDLNDYGIFTTGAYPLFGGASDWTAAQKQIATVSEYGLGYAVVDAKPSVSESVLSNQATMQTWVTGTNSRGEPYGAYATMYFDRRTVTTSFGNQELPASYCYVSNFIKQLAQYHPWEATAGTGTNANGRGVVGGIVDSKKLGGSVSDLLQPDIGVRVNPIQYIRNVGNVIMGNATLNNNSRGLVNYSFLNIRVLTAIVKRFWYSLGKTVLFEQNDAITFLTMKNTGQAFMDTLLDRGLRTEDSNGNKVEPYTIEKVATSERAVLKIKVSYYPIEAIERVEEEIELKDGYVTITE